MLAEGMRHSVDVYIAGNNNTFRQTVKEQQPDIIHVHGCNQLFLARAIRFSWKEGFRTVITPHGQLEPWVIKNQSTKEKAGRLLLLKNGFMHAYAVITLGRLERINFESIKWNSRIEEVHDAVITNAITPAEMCRKTFSIYQRIIDSNTLEQMDDITLQMLKVIIKVGYTGDKRWISEIPKTSPDWRRLLIYAKHENIRNYIDYGINILGLSTPMLDIDKIDSYFPESYSLPRPIKEIVGDYNGDENEYVVRMIHQIHKQPLLLHLIELSRELYRDSINDDRLTTLLENKGLKEYTTRLMQILSEETLLDEGFMPMEKYDDKQTNEIRNKLKNHLKI